MNKLGQLNEDIKAARIAKNSEKLQLLTTLKGEVDTSLRAEIKPGGEEIQPEVILANTAKKMVKGINEYLKHKEDSTLRLELTWLEDYIPKALSEEEIKDSLKNVDFIGNEGMRMRKAMEFFKAAQVEVDGKVVKEVISKYYPENASISN